MLILLLTLLVYDRIEVDVSECVDCVRSIKVVFC